MHGCGPSPCAWAWVYVNFMIHDLPVAEARVRAALQETMSAAVNASVLMPCAPAL